MFTRFRLLWTRMEKVSQLHAHAHTHIHRNTPMHGLLVLIGRDELVGVYPLQQEQL